MKAHIKVRCNKAYLATIREFVTSRLKALHVTGPVSHQIVLAVDEACANCMIHQHNCDNQSTIEVIIYREDQKLFTEIKDTGKAFPIDQYEPKRVSDIIEAKGKGGLGINLIRRIMDEINIEEKHDYFVYRLIKIVGSEPSPQA